MNRSALAHRIRRSRRRWWLLALLALVALSLADRQGWLLVPHVDDLASYDGHSGRVIRVIDGDTFDIDLPDVLNESPVTRIRMWGIDCPESAKIDQAAEPYADEATTFARDLIEGKIVRLTLEPHRTRGTFGRVLAHVNIPEQGSLNLALLEAGLTYADDRWPHKHLKRYAKAQRQAQTRELGLWKPDNDIQD